MAGQSAETFFSDAVRPNELGRVHTMARAGRHDFEGYAVTEVEGYRIHTYSANRLNGIAKHLFGTEVDYSLLSFDSERKVKKDEIDRLFGARLSNTQYRQFMKVLLAAAPRLVNAALNSPLFSEIDTYITQIWNNYVTNAQRSNPKLKDRIVTKDRPGRNMLSLVEQEFILGLRASADNDLADIIRRESMNLLLHDAMHAFCTIESDGQIQPQFFTDLRLNEPSLLNEEFMALALGTFGDNEYPVPFMLLDAKNARRMKANLTRQVTKQQAVIRGYKSQLRGENSERTRRAISFLIDRAERTIVTLGERIKLYRDAEQTVNVTKGKMTLDQFARLFFREMRLVFGPVQRQRAEDNYSSYDDATRALELRRVDREFNTVMDKLEQGHLSNPSTPLMTRLDRIRHEYPRNKGVIFEIWKDMVQPFVDVLQSERVKMR